LDPAELLEITMIENDGREVHAFAEFNTKKQSWDITGVPLKVDDEYRPDQYDQYFWDDVFSEGKKFFDKTIIGSYKQASKGFDAVLNKLAFRNLTLPEMEAGY